METQDAQDARVDSLWDTIAGSRRTSVDIRALKKGLRKLDHPLKNADGLLTEVLKAVDTDKDGCIQYNEFRTFVQETEKELLALFESIDRNNDNKLSKDELRAAFSRAGLSVPNSKLDAFFSEMDVNRDGTISFEEWRDFLLFIPATTPNLRNILTYYNATTHINAEGDADIASDDVLQGLGTNRVRHFLKLCIGSLLLIARPTPSPPLDDYPPSKMACATGLHPLESPTLPPRDDAPIAEVWKGRWLDHASVLIPDPGYFVAGGLAGVASRTSTAPLDRLKVYLIAQTSTAQETVAAAKSGNLLRATLNAWRPLSTAMKELWLAGGMRSLYAGNGLNVVKVMPESAIKFGAYEAAKRVFAKLEGHNDPTTIHSWSKFVAGGLAGMISQFAVYPIDTLKFRMQCETVSGGLHGNRLIMATARKMWQSGGILSYYRGLPMGLIGIFPYAALDLGTFEYLKRTIASRNARKRGCHEEDAQPGGFMTAAIGGFSGAFGASAVYPLNLLRTRLQSQGTVLHPRTYTGIMDVTQQTIKGEGVRGLFKGLTPNLLKVVPAVSITYVVYDKSKAALGLR